MEGGMMVLEKSHMVGVYQALNHRYIEGGMTIIRINYFIQEKEDP
jgi:hypothetical protein